VRELVPRRKISEYRAKTVVNNVLGSDYKGWSVLDKKAPSGLVKGSYVVKVDQAIKQRFKRGLIYLDVDSAEIQARITDLNNKGFDSILVEPYVPHDGQQERYVSFRREREGVVLSYSKLGGVEIEANADSIKSGLFDSFDIKLLARETGMAKENLLALLSSFNEQHLTLLEINPYVVDKSGGAVTVLDVAIEVDSSAELLVSGWSGADFRSPAAKITSEETAVRKLDDESPASFSLEVINKDGGIFLLLSGGGASVVIADEIFSHGEGAQLANYGEYSGNPNEFETKHYASEVFSLLLKSKAKRKVVLVGGAVANFTDIAATFRGIVAALQDYGDELVSQKVKFYVRRGGPRQKEGLQLIQKELDRIGLLGGVYDPQTTIPQAVSSLIRGVRG
jgi:succinyl-CoA synthetase beta subunit